MPIDSLNKRPQSISETKAQVLCIGAVCAVLAATLWPFNPSPKNGVRWLSGGGLTFSEGGLVLSDDVLKPPADDDVSYSIELLVRPARVRRSHTILAFYNSGRPKQLLVRQYADGLLVNHDASVDRDKTRTVKFDVGHVFHRGTIVQVTISSGHNGTMVYVDGQAREYIPTFRLRREEISSQIVLGTSPVTYHPWSGELHGLAIYAKELTPKNASEHFESWTDTGKKPDLDRAIALYSFSEGTGRLVRNAVSGGASLEVPASFLIPYKDFLTSPVREFRPDWKYAIEVVVNVAGFIPLGVILYACFLWSRRPLVAILMASVSAAFLSVVIEILQYYIPRRGSGITDIITNSLGAAIGALLTQIGICRRVLERLKLIPDIRSA